MIRVWRCVRICVGNKKFFRRDVFRKYNIWNCGIGDHHGKCTMWDVEVTTEQLWVFHGGYHFVIVTITIVDVTIIKTINTDIVMVTDVVIIIMDYGYRIYYVILKIYLIIWFRRSEGTSLGSTIFGIVV